MRKNADTVYTVEREFLAQITREEAALRAALAFAEHLDAEEKVQGEKNCPQEE